MDRDRAESIQREAMRVSQRFTAHDRRDAGGFQKRAHLLRMELATRHEHALRLRIHVALTLRQTSDIWFRRGPSSRLRALHEHPAVSFDVFGTVATPGRTVLRL